MFNFPTIYTDFQLHTTDRSVLDRGADTSRLTAVPLTVRGWRLGCGGQWCTQTYFSNVTFGLNTFTSCEFYLDYIHVYWVTRAKFIIFILEKSRWGTMKNNHISMFNLDNVCFKAYLFVLLKCYKTVLLSKSYQKSYYKNTPEMYVVQMLCLLSKLPYFIQNICLPLSDVRSIVQRCPTTLNRFVWTVV